MLHFKSIKKNSPPLKPEKRAVRFFIRIYPQYWVSSIRGHILPTALFFTFVYFVFKIFLGAVLFILTDKIKNPKPLISKKFGISVWCRWRGSNPHVLADTGFWIPGVCQFHHTGMGNNRLSIANYLLKVKGETRINRADRDNGRWSGGRDAHARGSGAEPAGRRSRDRGVRFPRRRRAQ